MISAIVSYLSKNLLAIIAIFISIISLIKSVRATREGTDVQKRILLIEQARENDRIIESRKAKLFANLVKETDQRGISRYLLKIENRGLSQARDVQVLLNGKHLSETPIAFNKEISRISPGQTIHYQVLFSFSSPAYEVSITWSDDSGQPGTFTSILSV